MPLQPVLKEIIKDVEDFPKPGITFKDVAPVLADPVAFATVVDHLHDRYRNSGITKIAALDARGFTIGSALAYKLKLPFVMVRKAGKLPGTTIAQEYDLEYGSAEIEIQKDSLGIGDAVVVVDDLIATGGTAVAAIELIESTGALVAEMTAMVDLKTLGGSKAIVDGPAVPVYALCTYN